MTDLEAVTDWVSGYVRAWNSNDPAGIGDLFAEDAAYYTAPFEEPWRGRETIVKHWLAAGPAGRDDVHVASGDGRAGVEHRAGCDDVSQPGV
jgi:uncharacterized protein (TIGR02246 family)